MHNCTHCILHMTAHIAIAHMNAHIAITHMNVHTAITHMNVHIAMIPADQCKEADAHTDNIQRKSRPKLQHDHTNYLNLNKGNFDTSVIIFRVVRDTQFSKSATHHTRSLSRIYYYVIYQCIQRIKNLF